MDEGVLDPWVAAWLENNALLDDLSPDAITLARGSFDLPVHRPIARVHDELVAGIPVRIYEHDDTPVGLIVYFHGGGWCIGSVSLMDNVARELAHATGAAVISVEYRLAPEHPFPAGLDDCETVTRWALAHARDFGAPPDGVMVAGESAGGNLSAAVALRLAADPAPVPLAGQVLVYPVLDARGSDHASRRQFAGVVVSEEMDEWFWTSYAAGRDIDRDPFAVPLHAPSLAEQPPALVITGGCDFLRDEGRAYAQRLRDAGVDTEDICFAGQPHGFVNFEFPAAAEANAAVGRWVRRHLGAGT